MTLYKVTPQPNDMAYFSVINLEKTRSNVTSETDAPLVVQKSMEPYGGLPADAKMSYDKTEYLNQIEFSNIPFLPAREIPKYPVSTNVQYSRIINGHQVAGDGGSINIELGNYGELLYLDKVWRTITPSKAVPIISASQALEKMQRGEILGMQPKCSCELTVNKIVPTYYEKGRNVSQEYLDPVWVFAGILSDGEPWHYEVSAWQFANFTEVPGPTPLSIQFNDTSDASPAKWLWDFGDGMTATDQSPVHSYGTAGSYNVTFTGWNDLGSDTVTKNVFVRNNPVEIPTLNSPLNTTSGTQDTSNSSN
jgi:TusA-related sulfurtransferase